MLLRPSSVVRTLAWIGCVVGACVGLWLMADGDGDELTLPIAVIAGFDALLALALYVAPGCLDPRQMSVRLKASVAPGIGAVLLQLVVGFLLFPVTLVEGEDPDRSWFAVVALVVLCLGAGAYLLAMIVFAMILGPAAIVALRTRASLRGDLDARYAVLLSLLLLAVVAFAVSMVTIDPVGGRRGQLSRGVALLLGLSAPEGGRTLVAWAARLLLVLLLVLVVALRRVHRAIAATGADPNEPATR